MEDTKPKFQDLFKTVFWGNTAPDYMYKDNLDDFLEDGCENFEINDYLYAATAHLTQEVAPFEEELLLGIYNTAYAFCNYVLTNSRVELRAGNMVFVWRDAYKQFNITRSAYIEDSHTWKDCLGERVEFRYTDQALAIHTLDLAYTMLYVLDRENCLEGKMKTHFERFKKFFWTFDRIDPFSRFATLRSEIKNNNRHFDLILRRADGTILAQTMKPEAEPATISDTLLHYGEELSIDEVHRRLDVYYSYLKAQIDMVVDTDNPKAFIEDLKQAASEIEINQGSCWRKLMVRYSNGKSNVATLIAENLYRPFAKLLAILGYITDDNETIKDIANKMGKVKIEQ